MACDATATAEPASSPAALLRASLPKALGLPPMQVGAVQRSLQEVRYLVITPAAGCTQLPPRLIHLISHHLLLAAYCSLLTAHYSLLTTHSPLLTPHRLLLTTHHSLSTVYYSPLTPHSSPLTPHHSPPTTQHPLPRPTVAAARATTHHYHLLYPSPHSGCCSSHSLPTTQHPLPHSGCCSS